MRTTPILEYFVSDTFGRKLENPMHAEMDVDVHLTTDLARLADALRYGDATEVERFHVHQKVNAHGRALPVGQHLAKMMLEWNQEHHHLLEEHGVFTGLFINDAPRDQKSGGTAPEFFTVETNNNLRIVTSPLEAAGTVAPHASKLWKTPNLDNNGLWTNGTQFRSATAHNLLRRNHPYRADEVDPDLLNGSDALGSLRLRYVDIYGNLITYGEGAKEVSRRLQESVGSGRRAVQVMLGGVSQEAHAAKSLEEGKAGSLIVYPNGGSSEHPHIDIAFKWSPTVRTPAYAVFQSPVEGRAELQITFPTEMDPLSQKSGKNVSVSV